MRTKQVGVITLFLLISILVSPIAVFGANNLKLGLPNQPVDDIVFTESVKEAIKSKSDLNFVLPKGVTFTSLPVVEVTNGNLEIDSITNASNSDGREYLKVRIKSESSVASSIKISGIRLTLDRTVPNGPLYLEVSGNAINETDSIFPGRDILKVQLGEVNGTIPDMSVAFKVGSQVYYQNGNPKVMDATPYIKESRTFVPLRFLLTTLGVDERNISFDNGKVIFDQGSKRIELTVGSNQLVADGKTIFMDVSPEEQNGRVMLPVRSVAEILGAQVDFAQDQIIISKKPVNNNKQYQSPPEMIIDQNKQYIAEVNTNLGTFKVELLSSQTPITVNNFVFLARNNFYNGVKFHRVIKDFMIQTGDPTGTGTGGPGYTFKDELPSVLPYDSGIVAMANSGPNTNGSQFFICNGEGSKALNNNPNYTVFGQVIEGMEVVQKISAAPVQKNKYGELSSPIEDLHIKNITITEK